MAYGVGGARPGPGGQVGMENVAGKFEDLLALNETGRAVRTVGLDYEGSVSSLTPLLELDSGPSARVSAVACGGYKEADLLDGLSRTFELLGLWESLQMCRRVVVKIGLIEGRIPEAHVTPHPQFVRALLSVLTTAIDKQSVIAIVEGTGHDRDAEWVLERTGIADILAEYRVPFINLNEDDLARVDVVKPVSLYELMLPRSVIDADFVISIAKMKTHHRSAVTLGMKNLFGCVPGSVYGFPKTRLHYAGTARAIADVAGAIQPGLTLIDGIIAMEGMGPLDGNPRPVGVIVAGENVATTDFVATRMMGFEPCLVPQFWYVLGKGILLKPEPVGDSLDSFQAEFEPPGNITWLRGTATHSHDRKLELLQTLIDSSRAALSRGEYAEAEVSSIRDKGQN